jgi:hypothetical protein
MTGYSVIEADIQHDLNDILSILKENLGEYLRDETFEWKYKQCPYGPAHCWLARHEPSNTFIGTAALFPRVILVKGEPVYTAIAGDFAVNKQHRNLRPAFALQKEIQSKIHDTGFKFIYSLPNDHSKNIFSRIGYKKIGRYTHFFKPLTSEYKTHQYLHPLVQIKIFAKAVDFLIKNFAKETRYKSTLKYSVEIPEYFDERFDVFWKTVSKHFTIIGERTSAFLNWRYMQSPGKKYKIFCLLDEYKNIIGYIIYFLDDGMCHVMDMLYEPSSEGISLLLSEFLRFIRSEEIRSISVYYMGGAILEKKLREFNFLPVNNKIKWVIIYSPDIAADTDLLDKENWHFFTGDNDV